MTWLIGLIAGASNKVLYSVIVSLMIMLGIAGYVTNHNIKKAAIANAGLKQAEQLLEEQTAKLIIALEISKDNQAILYTRQKKADELQSKYEKTQEVLNNGQDNCLDANLPDDIRMWFSDGVNQN